MYIYMILYSSISMDDIYMTYIRMILCCAYIYETTTIYIYIYIYILYIYIYSMMIYYMLQLKSIEGNDESRGYINASYH